MITNSNEKPVPSTNVISPVDVKILRNVGKIDNNQ